MPIEEIPNLNSISIATTCALKLNTFLLNMQNIERTGGDVWVRWIVVDYIHNPGIIQ